MTKPWHKKWTPFAVADLGRIRAAMRQKNLFDVDQLPTIPGSTPSAKGDPQKPPPKVRTADGSYTDAKDPDMGRAGRRMGRNMPLDRCYPDDLEKLLTPNPRTVSRKLLTRDEFIPATSLNLMAAVWIQFMQHGWFSHFEDEVEKPLSFKLKDGFDVPLEEGDRWPEADPPPEADAWADGTTPQQFRPMRISKTPSDPTRAPGSEKDGPPTFVNKLSHWWDASQLYGSDEATLRTLRTGQDGKMRIGEDWTLPYDPDSERPNIPVIGFIDNWWIGLAVLYKLFLLEHNAICDRLSQEYPDWSDDELFDHARLIVCALLAKIHTVEWTTGLLGTKELDIAMCSNWYGLKKEKRLFYRVLLGGGMKLKSLFSSQTRGKPTEEFDGIPATEPDHHAAPYSLTEEFNAMYRLHPLIPDDYQFRSAATGEVLAEKNLHEISGNRARTFLESSDLRDLTYTLGVSHPGALRLHNYPRFLQNLKRDNGDRFDLAAIDILRDRERGIPRYNEFRTLIDMPRIERFEDLTDNPEWAEELREVYDNDIDSVDLMVGMFAEPLLPGFAISEVQFRIFILMACRRLKSDRFFTSDYRPEVYTKLGIDWIEDNTMRDVILRHMPELEPMVHKQNAFAPWTPVEIQKGVTPSVAPNLKPKGKPHHAMDRRVAE